ncbi:hypothetical protein ACHAQJ_005549 [Trichoderma viride]
MCYYTVAAAVYENCVPDPPHLVKCVIFMRCKNNEDPDEVCQHPKFEGHPAILSKHYKKGQCGVCPTYTIPIREGSVATTSSAKTEDSIPNEHIVEKRD